MAYANIRLDHDGIADVLKGQAIRSLVDTAAASVASGITATISSGRVPVTVGSHTTDRAAASVTIAHPAGLAIEAKHGALVRAAAAAGLEVRAK